LEGKVTRGKENVVTGWIKLPEVEGMEKDQLKCQKLALLPIKRNGPKKGNTEAD